MYIYEVFFTLYFSIKCLKKLFPPLYKEATGWVISNLALKNSILNKLSGPFQCWNFEAILSEKEGEEEEKALGFALFSSNHKPSSVCLWFKCRDEWNTGWSGMKKRTPFWDTNRNKRHKGREVKGDSKPRAGGQSLPWIARQHPSPR